jgi:hypothetical protein
MKTLIRNIGQIVSGDVGSPLLDGDSRPLSVPCGRATFPASPW